MRHYHHNQHYMLVIKSWTLDDKRTLMVIKA